MRGINKKVLKEFNLVSAIETEKGREALIDYLKPLVRSVADSYLEMHVKEKSFFLSKEDKKKALEAGWKYVHLGAKKYFEKMALMEKGEINPYSFSDYITWFIKQGVHEYLWHIRRLGDT